MKIKTAKDLESTSYRCLFEGIKEEGVEPFLGLVQDIQNITERENLIRQTLFSSTNDLVTLKKKHCDILKYFKSHKKDLVRLNIINQNVLATLNSLSSDNTLLNLYLENARKLEALKIYDIHFKTFKNDYKDFCGIYRNEQGKIINISKYYTDGQIESNGEEVITDRLFNYSRIYFSINLEEKMSFLLRVQNNEHLYQYRGIEIENFGFDGTKLPSEDELQKYEIPNEFIRKRSK